MPDSPVGDRRLAMMRCHLQLGNPREAVALAWQTLEAETADATAFACIAQHPDLQGGILCTHPTGLGEAGHPRICRRGALGVLRRCAAEGRSGLETHPAPVEAAYLKYKERLVSVQGFVSIPGIPAALATSPALGLHAAPHPEKEGLIYVTGIVRPERGKPYIAIGRLSKNGESYTLVVTEWKKVKE